MEGTMSRYIQQDFNDRNNNKKPSKKEKPRELPKSGRYTMENLENTKRITTPNGGSR